MRSYKSAGEDNKIDQWVVPAIELGASKIAGTIIAFL
jgi:hypothetical protein